MPNRPGGIATENFHVTGDVEVLVQDDRLLQRLRGHDGQCYEFSMALPQAVEMLLPALLMAKEPAAPFAIFAYYRPATDERLSNIPDGALVQANRWFKGGDDPDVVPGAAGYVLPPTGRPVLAGDYIIRTPGAVPEVVHPEVWDRDFLSAFTRGDMHKLRNDIQAVVGVAENLMALALRMRNRVDQGAGQR